MSLELVEPLARLVTTAEAIEGLRDLFAAEEPLDDMAARVAQTPVAACGRRQHHRAVVG
jgi:hypothetical protein